MHEATRLTGSRDLAGATAAIQAALQSAGLQQPDEAAVNDSEIVLDVQPRELHDVGQARTPTVQDSFTSGHAHGRDYKLYSPPATDGTPRPLIVMLHGCTQDPDDFAAGTRMNDAARASGCFVLYPAQSHQANPQRCWNWFKHSHQVRGRGEPAMIAAITRDIIGSHAIDPARVYVAGLSAGAAMAAILLEAYPDLYAAAGIHSGLAVGSAKDLPSALSAMQSGRAAGAPGASSRPVIVFHGDADKTVHPSNGDHVIASVAGDTAPPEMQREQSAGGRDATRSVYRDAEGRVLAEHWVVHGSGHAWAGGSKAGSYTDAKGPDATAQMLRFFLEHPQSP